MDEIEQSEGVCRVCGKPLKTAESIAAGIGPICENREHLIASIPTPDVLVEPPEGYIPITDIWQKLDDLDIPWGRFTKAIGGDRALGKPRSWQFKPVYVGGRRKRYFPKEVLDLLPGLLNEGRGRYGKRGSKPSKPKRDKPGRPKKPPKPKVEFDAEGYALANDVPSPRRLYRVLTNKYGLFGSRVSLLQFQAFQKETGGKEVTLHQEGHGWYDSDGDLILVP